MRRKIFIFSTVLLLSISTSLSAQTKKDIILSGLEVVPDVHTPATGAGQAWIESDTLYVRLEFENLKAPYLTANVHFGEEDETGNPIYQLTPALSEDHLSGAFDPDKNKFALSNALKRAFQENNLYISIASEEHRSGEIRGQIDGF